MHTPDVRRDTRTQAHADTNTHLVGESEGRGGVAGTVQIVGLKARLHELTLFPARFWLQPARGHHRPQGGDLGRRKTSKA